MRRTLVTVLLAAATLSACGQGGPTAVDAVQNYVSALAEGNFGSACAGLDQHAQASLMSFMRSRQSCAALLPRCFPDQSTILKQDQTQLLYGTVQINTHGSRGYALTGGTLVAKEVKEVDLISVKGLWELNSYGKERCVRPGRHRRR
jgi:hypothetical protein